MSSTWSRRSRRLKIFYNENIFQTKLISDQLAVVHLKSETNSTAETSKTKLWLGDFLPDNIVNKHNINYDIKYHNHHHFHHHQHHDHKEDHDQTTTTTSLYSRHRCN